MLRPLDGLLVLPMAALALWTFIVALLLFRRRVAEMRAKRIHPQAVAAARDMTAKLEDNRASDHYRNLFESPVLFYAALLAALVLHASSWLLIVLAWAYVALRIVHGVIHTGYNKVMHRLYAFAASLAVLLAIWVVVLLAALRVASL